MISAKLVVGCAALLALTACNIKLEGKGEETHADIFVGMENVVTGPLMDGVWESGCTRTPEGPRTLVLTFRDRDVTRDSRFYSDVACAAESKRESFNGRFRFLAQMTETDYRVHYRFADEKGETQNREETFRWLANGLWVAAYNGESADGWLLLRPRVERLPVRVIQWTNLRTLNLRPDKSYDVICEGGQREVVTALDLSTGNVCPQITAPKELNVISVQRRSDGHFDVVCQDNSRISATEEDLLNRQLCPRVFSRLVLQEGDYLAPAGSGLEDQRVRTVMEGNQMKQVFMTSLGSGWSSTLNCSSEVCTGPSSRAGAIEITILGSDSYRFKDGQITATFVKK